MPAAASPYQQLALLQLALQEQQANLSPATRAGLSNQGAVGRAPSALALNAYMDVAPSAGSKDSDFQRQRTEDLLLQDEEQAARTKARLTDPIEMAKAAAEVRGFNTRRNVTEAPPEGFAMAPVSSHGPATRNITKIGADAGAPPISPIRRFSDSGSYADPEAAMGSAQRTMLDPRVVAAGISASGRGNAAQAKADEAAKTEQAAKDAADANSAEVVRLATKLRNSDYLNANVGPIDSWIPTVRGGSREFQNDAERLKNLLALRNRSQLKGQGAVSDFEGRMLASSATSLNPGTDEDSYKRELDRIIANENAGSKSAGSNASAGSKQEFDYVNGKLVPR